jgi:acylphosphatase
MPTLEANVRGVVQGVGFRHFVRRTAHGLGLVGEAVNLPDGSVHLMARGPRKELEALLAAVRRGPVGSWVEDVEHTFGDDPEGDAGQGFDVR